MSERPKIIERLMARQEHHRRRHPAFRIAWGAAGVLVLLAGLIMLVTPGPAFVLLPVGPAMPAPRFGGAERRPERALGPADKARERAENATRTQRILGALGTVALIAA